MSCGCCNRGRNERPSLKNRSFDWKEITAWSMLDFSNSIILMVLLGNYTGCITNYLPLGNTQEETKRLSNVATNNLMYANIAVSVFTLLISPPVGVMIDNYYIRLPIVVISVVGYSVMMMALYGVKQGDSARPLALYAFGVIFFRLNEMVAGAFLPGLCNEKDMGFVSSYGYFIGFLSGVVINLLVKLFTTPNTTDPLQIKPLTVAGYSTAMLVCGIVCLLSALPPMLMLDNGIPEGEKRPKFKAKAIGESFKQTGRAIRDGFKVNKVLTLIMVVYIFLSVGLQAQASYGSTFLLSWVGPLQPDEEGVPKFGVTINDLQLCAVYYNAAVAVFSVIWALTSWVISSYWIVILLLILYLLGTITGFWYRALEMTDSFNPGRFYIWFMYVLYSISVGPVQAILRGVIGLLAPEERKGEVFGCLESMILIGVVLGSTVPRVLVHINFWAFNVWVTAFLAFALILWIFLPVRREEKKAWARVKARDEAGVEACGDAKVSAGAGVGIELNVNVGGSSESSSSSTSSSSSSTSSSEQVAEEAEEVEEEATE